MNIKAFRIGDIELKNRYVQAPLAGFSDLAMRNQAYRHGAGLTYTEMISATALARGSEETLNMVKETQRDEGPVALQLFGSDEEDLKKAIQICEENGKYAFLDFNLGCPVPKVMKQDSGSHLLKDLDKVYSLLKTMVNTSKHPVVAKARLGYSNPEDCVKVVDAIQNAGVKAIAMHGRTRNEFYLGTPHYDLLKKAREECKVAFIANGNLGLNNFLEVLDLTKADALMFGRNAIGNPLLFEDLIAKEKGESVKEHDLDEKISLVKEFLDLEYSRNRDPMVLSRELRASVPAFFNGTHNAKRIRGALVHCSSKEEYLKVISDIENHRLEVKEDEKPEI